MRVTVMGASGLIGSKVVDLLSAEGHEVVAASRSSGVDAITGDGIGNALGRTDDRAVTAAGGCGEVKLPDRHIVPPRMLQQHRCSAAQLRIDRIGDRAVDRIR